MNLDEIRRCAERLAAGQLVVFPTETVYGLGANALDPDAVLRIFELKGRPRFDPLIVHAANTDMAFDLARQVPDAARRLATRFWPGPLTIVLEKVDQVPDVVTSGLPTVGLRVPAHPLTIELLQQFGGPVAAPSANRFGRVSPTTASHVREEFGEKTPCVLDGGPCRTGVESTIVSLVGGRAVLLRPGGTPVESIESVVGPLLIPERDSEHPASPGQLPSHYAPRTPLVLLGNGSVPAVQRRRSALLAVGPVLDPDDYACVEILSASSDLREAARGLFAAIRRLDSLGLEAILAHPAPAHGLGLAINDRLLRASRK